MSVKSHAPELQGQEPIRTPDWVKHAVFYQIFPDRFARSERLTHRVGTRFQEWGSAPTRDGYQGGDLLGIVEKLDYLQELGINALYLTPIFTSASNHRYHTYDYFDVDPLLGGISGLRALIDSAHQREMYVVLDGVFNHTGRGFWPFHHILENGGNSPYIDWFTIQDWPLRPYPEDPTIPCNYAAWWSLPDLPKLNTNAPAVREYIYEVARHWIAFGADGWRLDVPHEIDDDEFWRTFRQVVKQENPDAYICGEIWNEARRWLQGDQFDAVMNYLFTTPAISFCAAKTFRREYKHHNLPLSPMKAEQLAEQIERMYGYYDWEINFAQMNMLDSHDMARALWIMQDESALRLCVLLQMTIPGAPCIFYGDEVGLSGGDDPECRQAFPWHDDSLWNRELLEFYRQAIALRQSDEVFRVGEMEILYAEGEVFAFSRKLGERSALVVLNVAETAQEIILQWKSHDIDGLRQVWPVEKQHAHSWSDTGLKLSLPARDAVVLMNF